jgi:hypothetical protein
MYLQRYLPHLPAAGEIVIFDRSWYNRAGVERVMGFTSEEQVRKFLTIAPRVEAAMVHSGIILIKYWLEVSPEEQTRRLESRVDDPRKIWKLSPMDVKSYSRWFDYSRARDDMFAATDTSFAPWHVVRSDDKRRARLNLITHLLKQIPYKELPRDPVKLPKRQKRVANPTIRSNSSRNCTDASPLALAGTRAYVPHSRDRDGEAPDPSRLSRSGKGRFDRGLGGWCDLLSARRGGGTRAREP